MGRRIALLVSIVIGVAPLWSISSTAGAASSPDLYSRAGPGQYDLLRLAFNGDRITGSLTSVTETGTGPFGVATVVYPVRGKLTGSTISFSSPAFSSTVHGRLEAHEVLLARPYALHYRATNISRWRTAKRQLTRDIAVDNAAFNVTQVTQTLDDQVSNAGDYQQQIQSDLAAEMSQIQLLFRDADDSVAGGIGEAIGGPGGLGQQLACGGASQAQADYSEFETQAEQLAEDVGLAGQVPQALQTETQILRSDLTALMTAQALVPSYSSPVQIPAEARDGSLLSAAGPAASTLSDLLTQVTGTEITNLHDQASQQLERAVESC